VAKNLHTGLIQIEPEYVTKSITGQDIFSGPKKLGGHEVQRIYFAGNVTAFSTRNGEQPPF
jgi:hypothetical protein